MAATGKLPQLRFQIRYLPKSGWKHADGSLIVRCEGNEFKSSPSGTRINPQIQVGITRRVHNPQCAIINQFVPATGEVIVEMWMYNGKY